MPRRSPPTIRPRGPLPARVYWVRRSLVLGLALLLVVGVSSVLSRMGDATDTTVADPAPESAAQAAGSPSAADAGPTLGPAAPSTTGRRGGKRTPSAAPTTPATPEPPPLPTPEGPCESGDISVAPVAGEVIGAQPIGLQLDLRSTTVPACTWSVSPETLTATITSGDDHIWSTRECPSSITVQDVVLYQEQSTPVVVTWSGRRADEGCTNRADFALPGFYHVEAAALGGEPADVQFELVPQAQATVTKTVQPKKG